MEEEEEEEGKEEEKEEEGEEEEGEEENRDDEEGEGKGRVSLVCCIQSTLTRINITHFLFVGCTSLGQDSPAPDSSSSISSSS